MKAQATQSAVRRTRRPVLPVHGKPRRTEPGERESMIAESAYYRAEARGFEAGHELEDWLAA